MPYESGLVYNGRAYIRKTLEERFLESVIKTDEGCWGWKRKIKAGNYPALRLEHGKSLKRASHMSWELSNGAIPEGLCVLHRCDNRICTNPDHLFLGTRSDNQADMAAKDRSCFGEKNHNHKLTENDVRVIRSLAHSVSQKSIARQFNVHPCAVSRVVSGKRWRRVI